MGLFLFLLAEQSTMTTESGSDSESKPEQEAEPQEAAGPQGPAGAQQLGPEEQRQALEQFEAAAAHSTPVRKEVSPGTRLPHCPAGAASPRKPIKECLLSFFGVWSDLGLLALQGTMRSHLLHPFWSQADENWCSFKAFNEWHSTTMLGNSFIWLKLLNSHWNLDSRLLVLSGFTGRLDTTLMALIMLLIFIQVGG